jgi:hypothetical protein
MNALEGESGRTSGTGLMLMRLVVARTSGAGGGLFCPFLLVETEVVGSSSVCVARMLAKDRFGYYLIGSLAARVLFVRGKLHLAMG